jgi:hypothetical protein
MTQSHVHLQVCVEAINRTWGKDCCPLAVDHAQVVYKKDAGGPCAVYAKLHSERIFSMCDLVSASQWTASNTSSLSTYCICHVGWVVVICMHQFISDESVPLQTHVCWVASNLESDTDIPSLQHFHHENCMWNAYWCTQHSKSYCCILLLSLPSEVLWTISKCSMSSVLWLDEGSPYGKKIIETKSVEWHNYEMVTNLAPLCCCWKLSLQLCTKFWS